jgi:hypothetical protein
MRKAIKKAPSKAVVKVDPFPNSAKQDYPFSKWETEGRVKYEALQKDKPKGKLSKYEQYLLQHHFPKQEQLFATHAAQRRKAERKRRNANTGLAEAEASDGGSPQPEPEGYVRRSAKVLDF